MLTFKAKDTGLLYCMSKEWDVLHKNKKIGRIVFERENQLQAIVILPKYRGKGWMPVVYAEIERQFDVTLKPSSLIVSDVVWKYWLKRGGSMSNTARGE